MSCWSTPRITTLSLSHPEGRTPHELVRWRKTATAAIAAWELGLPFSVALLLGAVLAITDTVSVLLAFRSVRVPHRLAAIMEGESLFNDGTALVLVSVTASVVIMGSADPAQIGRMLLIAIVALMAVTFAGTELSETYSDINSGLVWANNKP